MRKLGQIEINGTSHGFVIGDKDVVSIADSTIDFIIGYSENQVKEFCKLKRYKLTFPHQRTGDIYCHPGR